MRIVVFTQTEVQRCPRVLKESAFLKSAGHDVTVVSVFASVERYRAGIDAMFNEVVLIPIILSGLRGFFWRFKRKLARILNRQFSLGLVSSLGYAPNYYYRVLLKADADLYVGHQELSMFIARRLIRRNKLVFFDFEDYHSEDLSLEDRKYRPINRLRRLENYLVENAEKTYTTSFVLSGELMYNKKVPGVLYNIFPEECEEFSVVDSRVARDKEVIRLVWISQVIGNDRGLSEMVNALGKFKREYILHLYGDVINEYTLQAPPNVKVDYKGYLPKDMINSTLRQYDFGLACEIKDNLNRDLTITNKAFHYLSAGIGIIATPTKGHKELSLLFPQILILQDEGTSEDIFENICVWTAKETHDKLKYIYYKQIKDIFCL